MILATLLIIEKLFGVGLVLSGNFGEVKWYKSVVLPIGLCLAIAILWQGDNWLRWLVAAALVLSGGLAVFVGGRMLFLLAGMTPPEATGFFFQVLGLPIGLVVSVGLFHVAAGLSLLFSPRMRAFFRYQRERTRVRIESI